MAVVKIKGEIKYKVKRNHPDLEYIPEDERDKELMFDDIYTIDTDNFWSNDAMRSYIEHDLRLVAGGGYATDTIKNVRIKLSYI
jgi:hypothetical protein